MAINDCKYIEHVGIESHLKPFGDILSNLEPCGAIWIYLELFRAIEDPFQPVEAIWVHLEPFGAILSNLE